jgi:hypothetical protein
MRTLQLDGSGNKNQDRSIQPSAIVGELPPFALAPPTPTPRPTAPPAAKPPSTSPPGNPGGGGGNPGAPAAPATAPGWTVPPTTALTDDAAPPPTQGGLPAVIAGLFVVAFATLLGARRAERDRGASRSRRRSRP